MVCTKTLYNYVDAGLLGIKNIDLPYKLSRNTKPTRIRQNKRVLGDSISERPEEAETRQEFGHWEIDTVRGVKKETEPAILTLVERKSRYSIWLKIMSATAASVQEGMRQILTHFGERAQQVFKTITGDNGSEFAELFRLTGEGIGIYFTHPYSSWEKGTNERHNGLLRRFIPKGKSISGYGTEDILFIGDWANNLPRRILGYKTPEELFEKELDQIYAL
jgi:IS30 family transposase